MIQDDGHDHDYVIQVDGRDHDYVIQVDGRDHDYVLQVGDRDHDYVRNATCVQVRKVMTSQRRLTRGVWVTLLSACMCIQQY